VQNFVTLYLMSGLTDFNKIISMYSVQMLGELFTLSRSLEYSHGYNNVIYLTDLLQWAWHPD